jgi:hypothetical protein
MRQHPDRGRRKRSAPALRQSRSARLFRSACSEVLEATPADEEPVVRLVHEHLTKRLTELDIKEDNLLDLVEAGGAAAAKVRIRLMANVEERARARSELETQGPLLEAGAAVIMAALDSMSRRSCTDKPGPGTPAAQPSLLRQVVSRNR